MTIESKNDTQKKTKLQLGMVGGGQGAFIGAVHRIASRIDDRYELVAGALSSEASRAHASAIELGIDPSRSYDTYQAMAAAESAREDGIDVVAIVTPNHVHYDAARAFLEAGIHVICDKPLTTNIKDAQALAKLADEKSLICAVTYNYTGYPMVRQAQSMIASGLLGEIRVVQVEYPQDWLTNDLESTGQKQAEWRTDPQRAGGGGCVGDIGTHAYQLACYVSGLQAESLCADLTTFVQGRKLDDNVQILLRFVGGARGMLWASQVAPGNENALRLRVYGSAGGIEWEQEQPNHLRYTPFGEPTRLITRSGSAAIEVANRVSRIPAGHPEGYLEGFATIYTEVADALDAINTSNTVSDKVSFPSVTDGVKGVAFIEATITSSENNAQWVNL